MNTKFTNFQLLTVIILFLSINFAFAQQSDKNLTFSPTFEVATEGAHFSNLKFLTMQFVSHTPIMDAYTTQVQTICN